MKLTRKRLFKERPKAKGRKAWNKGVKGYKIKSFIRSEETYRKISETLKRLYKEGLLKVPFLIAQTVNKGKHHSEETKKKMSKSHRIYKGEYTPNWKGGITPENIKIRKSFEYNLWRKSCFERDNFICQKTKITGGKLVVHHINNFADFPELRLAIDNGVTLSEKDHRNFHHMYGYKNNTKEQLEEFLK